MTELRRLPPGADLTADLLAAVVELRPANSRGRLEAAKVFKALGRLLNLEGLEQLDALRGSYEPAERNLPTDVVLLEFVRAQREDPRWGWATAALLAYGCRPAELFSLQPRADGTATCLTVKRKSKLPATRTAMALPPAWVEELELLEVSRPLNWNRPADYDSAEARRQVLMWGKWMGRKGASFALYDMRHAWAGAQHQDGAERQLGGPVPRPFASGASHHLPPLAERSGRGGGGSEAAERVPPLRMRERRLSAGKS